MFEIKSRFLLFILLMFGVQSYAQLNQEERQGCIEDLKIYREIIETSHTGMNLYTTRTTFDSLFTEAQELILNEENISYREVYLTMANIHTKIRCGHSSFFSSEYVFNDLDTSKLTFLPIKFEFIKDTLVVAEDFRSLRRGDRIKGINGKTVSSITRDAFKIISSDGYNETFKYHQLKEEFFFYFFLLYGQQDSYQIDYVSYKNQLEKTLIIDALENGEFNFKEPAPIDPYYLSFTEDNIAVLTVNTFSTETKRNQKRFFRFLKRSFKEIDEKGSQNLILDIRENTGGDDGNDMELASYLIQKPFAENKYRKLYTLDLPLYPQYLHEQWKEMFGMTGKSDDKIVEKAGKMISREFYLEEDGAYYYKDKYVLRRKPKKLGFKGDAMILISGKVFSGGALFSALVRDKSDAVFIGEETGGGYYRHTGSIPLIYTLPNSKMTFSIFIVINEQDVDQKLFPEGSGIKPHHIVYPSIRDFVEERDVALEYAKKLLTAQ